MKNIFLAIFLISAFNAVGQNHLVGAKVGINLANINESDFLNQHDNRTGLYTGLSYRYLSKKHFTAGAELIYNQRGFRSDILTADEFGNPSDENYKSKFNYNYLSLPIKAGVNIGNKSYGFANFGIVPSLLIKANIIGPDFDSNGDYIGEETFNVTDRVSKFDFAGLVEIGGGYKFEEGYSLFTSIAYQYSFTSITNSEYFANSKVTHYGIALTIGVEVALK
ncbi:MAG TPA: porin family protein [Fulvivirga sp.]|nr:porin family protein [Fulvivirga sp.]